MGESHSQKLKSYCQIMSLSCPLFIALLILASCIKSSFGFQQYTGNDALIATNDNMHNQHYRHLLHKNGKSERQKRRKKRREQRAKNEQNISSNQETQNLDEAIVNDSENETKNDRNVDRLDMQKQKRSKKEQTQMKNDKDQNIEFEEAQNENVQAFAFDNIQNIETAHNDKPNKNEYHLDETNEGKKRWNNRFSAESIPKTAIKSPWQFKKNEDALNEASKWSKRTFWLLFCILFVNIAAIIYCIYGRQISACFADTQWNDIYVDKQCKMDQTSSCDFDDETDDEEYV